MPSSLRVQDDAVLVFPLSEDAVTDILLSDEASWRTEGGVRHAVRQSKRAWAFNGHVNACIDPSDILM